MNDRRHRKPAGCGEPKEVQHTAGRVVVAPGSETHRSHRSKTAGLLSRYHRLREHPPVSRSVWKGFDRPGSRALQDHRIAGSISIHFDFRKSVWCRCELCFHQLGKLSFLHLLVRLQDLSLFKLDQRALDFCETNQFKEKHNIF